MKWLLIWLLLTGTYLLGLLFSRAFAGDGEITTETLVYLVVIPAVQIVALAVVAYVRRQRPSPPRPSSPTAPRPPGEEGDCRTPAGVPLSRRKGGRWERGQG